MQVLFIIEGFILNSVCPKRSLSDFILLFNYLERITKFVYVRYQKYTFEQIFHLGLIPRNRQMFLVCFYLFTIYNSASLVFNSYLIKTNEFIYEHDVQWLSLVDVVIRHCVSRFYI